MDNRLLVIIGVVGVEWNCPVDSIWCDGREKYKERLTSNKAINHWRHNSPCRRTDLDETVSLFQWFQAELAHCTLDWTDRMRSRMARNPDENKDRILPPADRLALSVSSVVSQPSAVRQIVSQPASSPQLDTARVVGTRAPNSRNLSTVSI